MEIKDSKNVVPNSAFTNISGGVRIGDEIHYHNGQIKINRLLTNNPFDPPVFLGRDDKLQELHDRLFAGENFLMLVNGQGGIGKTSFVAKYWKKYESEYSHLAFLYVENGINNAFLRLARNLPIDIKEEDKEDQVLEKILIFLGNLSTPCLLVLDNADDAEELKKSYYDILSKLQKFRILITSRISAIPHLKSIVPYTIKGLENEDALKLFKKYYEAYTGNEDDIFLKIYQAVDRNTLVVKILAQNLANLNEKKQTYSLKNLYDDFNKKGLFSIREKGEVLPEYKNITAGTALQVIGGIYDLNELSEDEAKMMSVFAVLPAEPFEYEMLCDLLQAQAEAQIESSLDKLASKGWIDKIKDQSKIYYQVSPLVQELSREKNKSRLESDTAQLLQRLSECIDEDKNEIQTIITAYLPIAEKTIENLSKATDYMSKDAFNLIEDIRYFEKNIYSLKSDIKLSYKALKAYIEQKESEAAHQHRSDLLEIYQLFVHACKKIHQYEEAVHYQKVVIRIYREHYPKNKEGLANALDVAGDICYQASGKFLNKALEYYQEEGRLLVELRSSSIKIARWQNALALVFKALGGEANLLQAQDLLQKALASAIANFGEHAPTVAIRQSNLALVFKALGGEENLRQAQDLLQKALASAIANFGEQAPAVATLQSNLALVFKDLGGEANLLKAQDLLQKAYATCLTLMGEQHYYTQTIRNNLFALYVQIRTGKPIEQYTEEEISDLRAGFEAWLEG